MIAAQHKTISGASQNCLHTFTVSLYTSGVRIMEVAAMNRAPKIRIQLEVSTTPLAPHRSEELLEVILNYRMSTIKHVPWTTTPSAEGHKIGSQWLAMRISYKPVRVLLKNM